MRFFRSFSLCILRLYIELLSLAQQEAPSTHQRYDNCALSYVVRLHFCAANDLFSARTVCGQKKNIVIFCVQSTENAARRNDLKLLDFFNKYVHLC